MSIKSFIEKLLSKNKNYKRKKNIQEGMKDLPIGIQDFKDIITGDFVYVDKTKPIYELVKPDKGVYFLSRPRRFGKSLTLSTLEYLFKGEKELFEGTYIYDKHEFEKYPVIKLSMSLVESQNTKRLRDTLIQQLEWVAEDYGLKINKDSPKMYFGELIRKLSREKNIAILIDEYDKPLLDNINNRKKTNKIRRELRSFYSILKELGKHIKFLFVTGISKFSKVSIFSELNQMDDLTLDRNFSSILGYTKEDIAKSFPKRIKKIRERLGLGKKEFWDKLQKWYNGYSWNGEDFVYNPFSILNLFKKEKFENYWFESGTPTFITDYMDRLNIRTTELQTEVDSDFFSAYKIEEAPAQSFLFQAGYLTIKEATENSYVIDFPNFEVQTSFNKFFLEAKYELTLLKSKPIRDQLLESYNNNNIDDMIEEFKQAYSAIPHQKHVAKEGFYDSIAYTLLLSAGVDARAEESTSRGDSDIVLEKDDRVFIFEFKNDKPEVAIKQIKEKGYGEKYDKKKFFVGIELDFDKRNIVDYKVES